MNGSINNKLTAVHIAGDDVPLHVRRNAKAKRLILRVDRSTRDVKVTAPPHIREKAIRNFISQHLEWITKEREKITAPELVTHGSVLPFMGREHEVVFTDTSPRRVNVLAQTIEVGGPADQAAARLERWMRGEAKRILTQDARYYAEILGVAFARVSIGDMKTRWGSCSSQKTLKFNWRLILAPKEVRQYVAAHEVAHLLEMNHSDRFWYHVKTCMPDYMLHRRWLKKEGDALMLLRLRA